jgi:transcriptional regulator with XRE-family HTH domain
MGSLRRKSDRALTRVDGAAPSPVVAQSHDGGTGLPNVGAILRQLRHQRMMSLQEVAQGAGVSVSFLSAVERGQSDIALGRLSRLAAVFNHDIGSLLGYSARRTTPQFVEEDKRVKVNRGTGIDYSVIRLPGIDFELIIANFEPQAGFRDAITHAGIDIVYVTMGALVLLHNDLRYNMIAGDCTVYSGAYPHRFLNESNEPAQWLSIVTETVY